MSLCKVAGLLCASVMLAGAQPPLGRVNPAIREIVASISEERIAATMKKLESFGSRHVEAAGNRAARQWIYDQFRSYSPRLEVFYDTWTAYQGNRITRETELANVVAVLPGKVDKDDCVLVTGHYDSLLIVRKKDAKPGDPNRIDWEASAAAPVAPGVNDDGSGAAAVLELARVMSQHEFDKTLVFIAFTAEEEGLLGSRHYANAAKDQHKQIEAVLNNDIIGGERAGDGRRENRSIRLFSDAPEDSPSRALARYAKDIGERYVPAMKVDLVFRADRFSRGGDHTPFDQNGFAAVRFTTPAENYKQQHTLADTFANASAPYCSRAAQINAAVAASLALAPRPPVVTRTLKSGWYAGRQAANLSRGKSGYDAVLRWEEPNPDPDLAGFAVVMRSTLSPYWEKTIWVGDVREYTIPDFSIDDVVLGVMAIDREGNPSLVSAYVQSPMQP